MAKMTKEQMKGGLNVLFDGNPQEQPTQEQPQEANTDTQEGIGSVLDTLSDDELKQAALSYQHKVKTGKGRPQKAAAEKEADGSPLGYQRITTIANKEKMKKLRIIAEREGLTIKDVMEAMMDMAINTYEVKNGKIYIGEIHRGDLDTLFKM